LRISLRVAAIRKNVCSIAVIAAEIADDLEAALEQFTKIAARLVPAGSCEPQAVE
jgi:hypothetical protein